MTLINHLITSYFDKENYNFLEKKIISKNNFFENLFKNLISNVIFLESNDFKNISVETIRDLKNKLQKKPFYNDKRLIILDDVETFSKNSINALLKLIEEPNENDYFFLINNKFGENRYFKISERIYKELDERLAISNFLTGKNYSIADIATFPWIARHEWHDIGLKKFKHLSRWYKEISKRDAVIKGYDLLKKGEEIPKV